MTTPLEPFGFFRSTPFGWEDCSDKYKGAKALYEITPDMAEMQVTIAQLYQERAALRDACGFAESRIDELEAQKAQLVGVLDLFVQYEAASDRRDDVQGMLIYAEFAESARAALASAQPKVTE